jgi:hypothetical protein
VLVPNGELAALDPTQPEPTVSLSKLGPVAEHAFRLETKDGFGDNGELVVFEMHDQRNEQRAKFGENCVQPVNEW